MKVLGWIIWGFGCLLLLGSVKRLLRKKPGRIVRAIFCICIATGLALTFFTPISKLHLLWILPLPFLLGMIGFGLLGGVGWAHHKATARKPDEATLPSGRCPPFGILKWKDDCWEGEVRLPVWAGFQSRRGPYGSEDSESPADGSVTVSVIPGDDAATLEPAGEQRRAMDFQIQHGDEVVQSVLAALLPYYRELKKDWGANDKDMPPVSNAADFREMIGLSQVHVLSHVKDGQAHVGLEFGCDWDEEHGFGVVVLGERVVSIGQASETFDWQPEADPVTEN